MGWLEINRTQSQLREFRINEREARKRKREGVLEAPEVKSTLQSTSSSLEALPKELLEKIFIYSENLDLIHTSRRIMLKLQPHFYLESQFVLNQVKNGVAPVSVLMLPFVDHELLESINLRTFEPMTIPHFVLNHGDPEFIAYLLECGLNTDDHATIYGRLIDPKYTKLLVNRKYIPSTSNLLRAIELGNKYTHRMVILADLGQEDIHEVWNVAAKLNRKRVLKALETKL